MRVSFVDVEGVHTRVLSAGDGAPLILVHGIGLTADTWVHNIDALADRCRVIAPDMLGHGFTSAAAYTKAPQVQMAEHTVALARALGLERFSIGGSSFGGLVATLVALEHREIVNKLVIIGSGSVFHTPETRTKSLRATFANGSKAMMEPSVEACRDRLANICFDRASVPESILLTQATAYAQPDRLESYRAAIDGAIATAEVAEVHVIDRLEQIEPPTLVITGREDIRASVEQTRAGVARMRAARLEVYDRCGHLPYIEHPQRFNADVARFLDE